MMSDAMAASIVDRGEGPDALKARTLSRRDLLKGIGGAAGLAVLPGVLAACGTSASPTPTAATPSAAAQSLPEASASPTATPMGRLTLASVYPGGPSALVESFRSKTGIDVRVNSVDAASFQDQIIPYLQATPEDVITWGAARTRHVAELGLATPLDDVWSALAPRFPASVRTSATAADGHQYFVPAVAYGWAMFYRPDLFRKNGYAIPTTWPEFKALAARMLRDGLIPIAFGDAEVFEADGLFDILDLRLNGCQFHRDLLAGRERWTDLRVKGVFERWREIQPFFQANPVGRPFSDAIRALIDKKAGMYLMGSGIMLESAPADEIDVFPFPFFGNEWDAERSLDVPTDGYMVTRNSPTLATDLDNAKAFMEFVASASAQTAFSEDQSGTVALALDADTSGYDRVQKKIQAMIGSARQVAEFFDRDADAGFAYQAGFAFQDFLTNPDTDLTSFAARLQDLWDKH